MDILEQSLDPSDSEDMQLKAEKVDDPTELTIIDDDGSMSDDQTVDSLAHAQSILETEAECQWKADGGLPQSIFRIITYRVYHVNPEEHEQESAQEEFVQSSSGHLQPVVLASTNLGTNHFYVVNNDVISPTTTRSLAPRSNVVIGSRTTTTPPPKMRRDDRRRATHNEVERRRRDKINNWIMKLGKIIPECATMENNKSAQSKGCILAKACDYITELRQSNQKLAHYLKENERLTSHVDYLQSVNEKLKIENALLRQKHDFVADSESNKNLSS